MPIEVIEKSRSSDKKKNRRWVQGIASTDDKDLQDEKVVQSGIDLAYFLAHGYINDDHKPGPENKVGEPTEARITKAGLWIKGFLYKGQENSDKWWDFLNSLEQSDANRKVGFSIQGKVTRRRGKSILKCWLQDIAITAAPVNTNTWAEIAKSLNTQTWCQHPWRPIEKACKGCPGKCGDVGPVGEPFKKECPGDCEDCDCDKKALSAGGQGTMLVPESLEGGVANQTWKSVDRISYEGALEMLQVEKGYSPARARVIVDSIFAQHGLF